MHAWYMCVLYINLYLVQTSTVEALEGVGGDEQCWAQDCASLINWEVRNQM